MSSTGRKIDKFLKGLTGFALVVSLVCFALGGHPARWALGLDAFAAAALAFWAVRSG